MPMQTPASASRAIAAEGGTSGISTSSSGAGSTSSPNQQHDAVLRAFAALLSSAVATADDSRSLEHAITNDTRDLCAARSAGLPLLFSSEVLAVAHAQLRVAQAAAAAARKTKNSSSGGGGGGVNIRDVGGASSEDEDGDDDSSIWWLASAPSLDLRNKSKPLSSLLSRSLRMSPAVSAAFNLSLPVRAVCGRAEDLVGGGEGEAACGGDRTSTSTSTSTTVQAGSVLTNKTSLTILPRRLLQNVAASYKSLVDSRLRSSLSALLKRTLSSSGGSGIGGIGVHSSAAADHALLRSQTVGLVSLMSQSDAVVVTAAASSFRVVDVPGGSTDEGLDSTEHLHGRTVPLIFEVVLDVIVHKVKTTAILQAPGSLTGQFVARRMSASSRSGSSSSQGEQGKQKQQENQKEEEEEEEEPRLARVELTVDAPHLLQMMMEEARKAVREAVSACATDITAATTATTNIAEQQQQQQQQQHHPAQPQQQQRNLPRKVSDTLLRPGLKRKAPTSSSSTSLTSKSKIILPKPKRRSSAFSSTDSIIDEEGLASSSSGQQLSGGSDTFMPPPRPRSPLSKSRSSSRLLFYSGGRKSSAQDGLSTTSAAAITGAHPGRNATSKSANQNASWEEASYSSSASRSCSPSTGSSGSERANATNNNGAVGSAAAPSSVNASAATAAGFALLSMKKKSPKAKTSSQGKTGTHMSSGGIKRSRSDQNTPLKKRIVSRDG